MFSSESCYKILCSLTTARRFLIGYSGGLDSHVLLHAMATIRKQHPEINLQAIHLNHGLSVNAEKWIEHCQKVCAALAVELIVKNIKIDAANQSWEAAARAVRYQIFAEHLSADTDLLTAHTKNDQAETLLLQLLRGAGVKGLAAMPMRKKFATSFLLRPLLNFTREQLVSYASHHQLVWVEDESNSNLQYDRNFVRHQILPIIQQRWPDILNSLARSAKHCAEADTVITHLAQDDLQQVYCKEEKVLSIKKLLLLSESRQKYVVREWLQRLHFPLPSEIKLRQILHEVLLCAPDAKPKIEWQGTEIRRYQDKLYALAPLPLHDANWSSVWDIKMPLVLPNNLGELSAKITVGDGLLLASEQPLMVRFRQGGERCRPVGRSGSHPLKKLFQEWQVPPWLRDRIPLIYVGDQLAAVAGYCVCENYAAKNQQKGWIINYYRN